MMIDRERMRGTTFNKLAVVWFALWFGVIVPGHKRGLVLLPGAEPPAPTRSAPEEAPCPLASIMGTNGSCCPSSSKPTGPAPMPVTHCAMCYLMGVLDVPPPPDLAPKPQELVEVLPWPEPIEVVYARSKPTYQGRAPPVA